MPKGDFEDSEYIPRIPRFWVSTEKLNKLVADQEAQARLQRTQDQLALLRGWTLTKFDTGFLFGLGIKP